MIPVASYCRVSTDKDDQANSFAAQQRYFKEYIDRQPGFIDYGRPFPQRRKFACPPAYSERRGGGRMTNQAELLECRNDGKPGQAFLLEYQRGVLLALEKAGVLTREQLLECVRKLEKQTL